MTAGTSISMICASIAIICLPAAGESPLINDKLPIKVDDLTHSARLGEPFIDLGRGPVIIHEPSDYNPEVPTPLVLLLHGYSNTGAEQESYMQFEPLIDQYGYFYLHPDGTTDALGFQFWNATDACCNFNGSGVDDSGYLLALIDEMKSLYNIDDRRVYLIGHSNGGFMSYRMACDHPETIAAIASLAGATFYNPNDCTPAAAVHTLQIHGTNDAVIRYDGGSLFGVPYPGAEETVETWVINNDCVLEGEVLPSVDLVANIPGDETVVTRYATDCTPGGSAELWTIEGGVHSPLLSDDFSRLVIEFLLSHPKPVDCPADLTGDDQVNIDDIFAVLGLWGDCPDPCPPFCTGDLTEDCTVNIDDIFAILGEWGPCS